ncbi:MAG: putative restriction endonuclease, partial [Lentimonas sp.]
HCSFSAQRAPVSVTPLGPTLRIDHLRASTLRHQFAKSKNNNADNGLALSRDAHWMFDRGLWTISESNKINVADEIFEEWGPEAEWLKVRHNQKPIYKTEAQLRPAKKHLNWHRNNIFNGMDI